MPRTYLYLPIAKDLFDIMLVFMVSIASLRALLAWENK